jgi:hypothetical protein
LKQKFIKGKENGYIPKKNEWETESRQKQDDRTTLSEIKAQQGLMDITLNMPTRNKKVSVMASTKQP